MKKVLKLFLFKDLFMDFCLISLSAKIYK